ncbi:MAG: TRAP transporter substrate-binding protein [Tissierellia bacterium]|nr:TRAP transporter substrate-binding protein [Tissierellia bacterium]
MKLKSIILIVIFVLFLTACGDKKEVNENNNTVNSGEVESTDQKTIKIGHVEPEDRSTHKALLDFAKNVEERTDGSVKVEIYPNGSLGGDVQLTESVSMGTLDAALPSTSVLTAYTETFGILDMPYMFKDSQSAFSAMDGKVGEYFNKELDKQGIHNLGYIYNGPRSTTTNTGAIVAPDDLEDVKMRVMESPIFIDYYKTLGANPTPMSFTELYTGLQQGTVDAQENPPTLIYASKFHEVQKYLTVDEHVHNFIAFIINQEKFNSLSPEEQKIMTEEAINYVKAQREMELKDNEVAIKKLSDEGGLEVNILEEAQKKAFRDALQPMYDKYEEEFGKDLFEMCEEYNK